MVQLMQDSPSSNIEDQIDLQELFITLWAYKLFIAIICVICIFSSGYYALNTDKKYTSSATFNLSQDQGSGISVGGELGALASLAALGGVSKASLPESQVYGRIFIQKVDEKLNFKDDPFFNNYNPNIVDPIWKSLIKRAIGWKKSSTDANEAIWHGIKQKYSKYVLLEETDDGAIKVIATHTDAIRASNIANTIMEEIISTSKGKIDTQAEGQLSYLSNTLATALSDVEFTQSKLKAFALDNTAIPLETFAAGSLQLDNLREQLTRTSDLSDAVVELSTLLKNNSTNQASYIALREKFPVIDQVEFRRVLGQNEIISSWTWPDIGTVTTVIDTLTERKNRLKSQVITSQIEAERYGQALSIYAKLEREATIAEATYTVLIEQVKAQSMLAGYRPSNSEIFSYASPSINPSAPNRNLLLLLGAFIGLFLGSIIALIISNFRGICHSKKFIAQSAEARFKASSRTFSSLRNKSLTQVDAKLNTKSRLILRDVAVEIHKNDISHTVVTSSRTKLTANNVAFALAITMQSKTSKVAIIDFSTRRKKQTVNTEQASYGAFIVTEKVEHVSVLKPEGELTALELLSQKDFVKNIYSLNANFDLVFLCADDNNAISLLRALEGQKMFHLTIARTNRTRSGSLLAMRSLLPIQGLLYE
jgi:uncharacterized protein involved in exopolysaccharide biosynthesis